MLKQIQPRMGQRGSTHRSPHQKMHSEEPLTLQPVARMGGVQRRKDPVLVSHEMKYLMAPTLVAMASNLLVMASNLEAMAFNLLSLVGWRPSLAG